METRRKQPGQCLLGRSVLEPRVALAVIGTKPGTAEKGGSGCVPISLLNNHVLSSGKKKVGYLQLIMKKDDHSSERHCGHIHRAQALRSEATWSSVMKHEHSSYKDPLMDEFRDKSFISLHGITSDYSYHDFNLQVFLRAGYCAKPVAPLLAACDVHGRGNKAQLATASATELARRIIPSFLAGACQITLSNSHICLAAAQLPLVRNMPHDAIGGRRDRLHLGGTTRTVCAVS